MSAINILLIDDHTLFRTGLRFLLEQEENFNVIGEAGNGMLGIKLVEELKPDIVLLDLHMPQMDGRQVLEKLLTLQPKPIVVMLTVSEDAQDLTECMRIGANGYLLKNIETEILINSIYKVYHGDNVLSPEMTSKLISQLRHPDGENKQDEALSTLTQREKETLQWLARGESNKVIALAMNVAESTVKVYVQNILRKLGLNSRVQAAVYALEHDLEIKK